jgi:hypothetical protein
MKQLIMILTTVISFNATASSELNDEIVCKTIPKAGEADLGMTVVIRSNATAWKKQAMVFENGYLGSRQIAAFQIPLQPTTGFHTSIGEYESYKTEGFELALAVRSTRVGQQIAGPAFVKTNLPGYGGFVAALNCHSAK